MCVGTNVLRKGLICMSGLLYVETSCEYSRQGWSHSHALLATVLAFADFLGFVSFIWLLASGLPIPCCMALGKFTLFALGFIIRK